MGAVSRSVTRVLGDGTIDLNITSVAAGTPGSPLTPHYATATDLLTDAINARVWSGIHFRTADVVAAQMGTKIANWALDHYFEPTPESGSGDWTQEARDAACQAATFRLAGSSRDFIRSAGHDPVLSPRVQGVIHRQLELELALIVEVEESEAVRDRLETA